jgi:hypothetical protein
LTTKGARYETTGGIFDKTNIVATNCGIGTDKIARQKRVVYFIYQHTNNMKHKPKKHREGTAAVRVLYTSVTNQFQNFRAGYLPGFQVSHVKVDNARNGYLVNNVAPILARGMDSKNTAIFLVVGSTLDGVVWLTAPALWHLISAAVGRVNASVRTTISWRFSFARIQKKVRPLSVNSRALV